jgi:NADPH:quinone reductase-like Zn-dependent oxidoreductase
MSTNYAIVVQKPGESAKQEVPIPKLRDDYILVKVVAVALNPTDWKHIDFLTSKGCHVSYINSLMEYLLSRVYN